MFAKCSLQKQREKQTNETAEITAEITEEITAATNEKNQTNEDKWKDSGRKQVMALSCRTKDIG